jgi:hypothetical protein
MACSPDEVFKADAARTIGAANLKKTIWGRAENYQENREDRINPDDASHASLPNRLDL